MARTVDQDLGELVHNPAYANVVGMIHAYRENSIKSLQGASPDNIQQISGEVLAYDSMLDLMDWQLIQKIHFNKI
jgi:cell division ATPase FtsA